jgi:F-type H+-transporting ATPase subunit delta
MGEGEDEGTSILALTPTLSRLAAGEGVYQRTGALCMKDLVVAKKYAQAFFAQAQAGNVLQACHEGLEEFARVARLRSSLKRILEHPTIPLEEKKRTLHVVLGEHSIPLLERFLFLLVQKHRLDWLAPIAEAFQEAVDRYHKVQALQVRSAFAMSEAQQKQLQGQLEKLLQSKVRMEVRVDPALIGGLIVQTRDRVLDQSLKGQLQKLRRQLAA